MLERTAMNKSFKMVAIQTLLEEEALHSGLDVSLFCQRSLQILQRSPLLSKDIPTDITTPEQWERYWLRWLHSTWESEESWLFIENNRVNSRCTALPGGHALRLTQELVQYRLARYRLRKKHTVQSASLMGKVVYHQGRATLLFASPLPERLHARLSDGSQWVFYFQQQRCSMFIQQQMTVLFRRTVARVFWR